MKNSKLEIYQEKTRQLIVGAKVYLRKNGCLDYRERYDSKNLYVIERIEKCRHKSSKSWNEHDICCYCVGKIKLDKMVTADCYTCGYELDFDKIIPPDFIEEDDFSV